MSPSLLSSRLKRLERVGIVERRPGPSGAAEYHLTLAGEELRPIIESLGEWGQRWGRGDLRPEQLDASLLMWDIHRRVELAALPPEKVVVHFHLHGSPDRKRHFWLVLGSGEVDVCYVDPGYEIDLEVEGNVEGMVRYWMGQASFDELVRSGALTLQGPSDLVRAFPGWFQRSLFADVTRAP